MDTKRALGLAIRARRKQRQMTQQQLADATEGAVDQTNLSRIERGEQEPPAEKLVELARALGCRVSELWQEAEDHDHMVGEPQTRYDATRAPGVSYVPLISFVQAGSFASSPDAYARGTGVELIPTTAKVGRLAYALRVKGDSMTNPRGEPSFPDGSIIVVDQREANPGSMVIVKLMSDDETTFKKLAVDGGRRLLVPLNPQFPTMTIDQDAQLCGVVVAIAEREVS